MNEARHALAAMAAEQAAAADQLLAETTRVFRTAVAQAATHTRSLELDLRKAQREAREAGSALDGLKQEKFTLLRQLGDLRDAAAGAGGSNAAGPSSGGAGGEAVAPDGSAIGRIASDVALQVPAASLVSNVQDIHPRTERVVAVCAAFLDGHIGEDKLFFTSGDKKKVKKLIKAVNKAGIRDTDFDLGFEALGVSPHDVAAFLCQYLKQIPNPIFTHELFEGPHVLCACVRACVRVCV